MNARDFSIVELRPQILSARISPDMSTEEYFQNKILRPIIKLQNDLILEVFKNYIRKSKALFYEMTIDKRLHFIENAIQKDIKFRNNLKGMILGQFTIEEYKAYTDNSSALNKRMMKLVIQRIQDQAQLLELDLSA